MTISQIPGAVRLRRNQFGVQTLLNTAVAATRRVPWDGAIDVDPNWKDPAAAFGSLDPVALPTRGVLVISSGKTGDLYFNDLPLRLNAGLKGGVAASGAGTAKTWDYQLASLTSDPFDIFTNEAADDTEATDTTVGIGGVINSLEDTMPQDLGVWTISDDWVFSSAAIAQNGTDGLTGDSAGIPVLGGNTNLKMDPTAGAIGTTQLPIHDAKVSVNNNLDIKHWANGSNSLNQAGGFGRGERAIVLTITVPKTTEWVTEKNTWLTSPKPSRYFDIVTVSDSAAQSGIPYSDRHRGAFRMMEAPTETEIGGNVALVLTYHAFNDASGLGYVYRRTVINTQTTVAAA